jgi:uncharacterized membrane protein YphA (DoxX/SURF4 family)
LVLGLTLSKKLFVNFIITFQISIDSWAKIFQNPPPVAIQKVSGNTNKELMDRNKNIAALTTRLLLGFIFLMQGYGKVFTWGINKLYNMEFFHETYKKILPDYVTLATAYYTSYVELIGGFLLVLGFKRDYALYALASLLIIVTFGHGLAQPVWDLSHVMYRTILLITLLFIPKEWDKYSLDFYIQKFRSSKKIK